MQPGVPSWVIRSVDQQFKATFGNFKPEANFPSVGQQLRAVLREHLPEEADGYYPPNSREIWVAWDSPGLLETLVHENLHRSSYKACASHPLIRMGFQESGYYEELWDNRNVQLNEGITEALCDACFEGFAHISAEYLVAYEVATTLIGKIGLDLVTRWYLDADFNALESEVDRRSKPGTARRIAHDLDNGFGIQATILADYCLI